MVKAEIKNRTLTVQVDYTEETASVLLKLISSRNNPMSRFSDVSPRFDETKVKVIRQDYPSEMWFPVVDTEITPSMYGQIIFEEADEEADYTFNSWLWPERYPVKKQVCIPAGRLLEWENGLFVSQKELLVREFALYEEVPQPLTISRRLIRKIQLLSEDWAGTVEAFCKVNGEYKSVGKVAVDVDARRQAVTEAGAAEEKDASLAFQRSRLIKSLELNLKYILSSQIHSSNNPMDGGFYLFYDMDARTYRLPAWLWGWGPSIAALLESCEIAEIVNIFGKEKLQTTAEEAGTASLAGQVYQEDKELDGLSTARWDPNLTMENGYRQRVCTASDSGFLCGWAWVRLYEKTGNRAFLEAALKYAESAERFVNEYGIPPQDYMPEQKQFTAHTLDESGFGVKAFDALFHLTGEQKYRELGRKYIDSHIRKFRRPDGLWERSYCHRTDTLEPSIFMTRGLGWAMEGLLSAWTLTEDTNYLKQAEEMADYLLKTQNPDGSWNFMLNRTKEEAGLDDKGTPLWSLLLYRLYRACGSPQYLEGARKALSWCMANQIQEGDWECVGGLGGANPQAAVVYRPWFRLSCLYTSGFFALALLEELKIREQR
ncbi:MAG: hypothetical protein ACI4F3_05475 [Enterocloster sp.]